MVIDRNKLTPMMTQYFSVKDKYSDCILMYRLGDFYEMFFEDALTASKVLEIALTGRSCGLPERAPMCGVPFHSVDSYVVKLVEAGYSVAICEQTEDPSAAKGIVSREVVRIVTPGTIMNSEALDELKNNYLCSVYKSDAGIGLAFADITTGEIYAGEYIGDESSNMVVDALVRFMPKETVMNLMAYEDSRLVDYIKNRCGSFVRNYYDWAFSEQRAAENISETFGAGSPQELGFETGLAACALSGAVEFLKETQKTELSNIKTVEALTQQGTMQIDAYSMRNLEIVETIRDRSARGSLLHVLNKTKTAMGGRLMRKMITAPLTNVVAIRDRLYAVSELFSGQLLREEFIDILKGISDIERLATRVAYKTANCHDLLNLKKSFMNLTQFKELLSRCESKLLSSKAARFDALTDLYRLIDGTIDEEAPVTLRNGKMIKKGANEELDKTRDILENGRQWLIDLVDKEKEKSGIKTMKLGYNKVFGYYIEVSRGSAENVPDYFIRKQTLVNAERYITPEIKELEESILNADAKVTDLEFELFCKVRDAVGANYERIRKAAEIIAEVDVLCSLAAVAEANDYVMPSVDNSDRIEIKDGRHPVVESIDRSIMFIPNDAALDCGENQIAIITGPNMAGKSTYMRQIAVITLMAQMGSFVPASSASIGVVDRIFTRVGASDDLSSGDSTFMVEMKEVAYILDNATRKSLIILDEIGRGTSTYDGLSIAWAVVEHIADIKKCGAKTLFATHYHELTELEETIDNVKNYCIAVKKKGDDITFLRKIIRGGADESYGVEVAALAGVKKSVIRRAKEIAAELEQRDDKSVSPVKIKTGRRNAKKPPFADAQMDFFAETDNPVIKQLLEIDLNAVTPMEALTKLYDLQAKAKKL